MGHFDPFPPPKLNGRCPFRRYVLGVNVAARLEALAGPAPLLRDRKFADSSVEGDGFELLVPRHKSRGFPEHSGHCGVLAGS